MRGERRAEQAQIRVFFKFCQHIQHIVCVFADILVTDIAKAGANASGFGLDGLFIVHKAGVIILPDLRGKVTQERCHIAAAVFDHLYGNGIQRQGAECFFDLLLFLRRVGGNKNVSLRRHVGGKGAALGQHIHKIQVHAQRNAAVFAHGSGAGLILYPFRNQAGQTQVAGKIIRVHGADHVFPDQLQRVIRMVPQVGVQFPHRLPGGIIQVCLKIMHKAAALEQRALFIPQQPRGADKQRIIRKLFQIVRVDIDIPLVAFIGKLFGKHRFIPLHRVGIAFDHGHGIPVILQLFALDELFTVDNKVGLNVHRQVIIKMFALKGVALRPMVDRQAPKIKVGALGHGVKHFFQGAHRAHQGRVRHDHFVKFAQTLPAVMIQRGFIGPHIQALVFAHNNLIGKFFKCRAALLAQLAVAHNDQLGQVTGKIAQVIGDKIIHITVFFVKEKNTQSFHSFTLSGYRYAKPASFNIALILVGSPQTPGLSYGRSGKTP